ncbi:MAG: primosomal protein N' [Prevotellaceae bacterium]|nr:primosomal protein N' [Prevotellaceae bacterium]
MSCFVDVILPLALPKPLTYSVPPDMRQAVQAGVRVAVQVGRRKIYAGVVQRVHSETPPYATKDVVSVLDSAPLVNGLQLALWSWVAQYYMCGVGEVMKAALPAALKMESETRVSLDSGWEDLDLELSRAESDMLQALQSKPSLSVEELSAAVRVKNVLPVMQQLLSKRAVCIEEQLVNVGKPRYETVVALHPSVGSEEDLNALFALTERAPQQEQLLLAYVSLALPISYSAPLRVAQKELLEKAKTTAAALKACVAKNIFSLYRQELRLAKAAEEDFSAVMPTLSAAQQRAYDDVQRSFAEKQVVLLHGVTSSGKTEIYMRLIEQAMAQGKQTLYLLPEIALTAQLITRLKKVFGNVGVYHSKFSDAQRVEEYRRLLEGGSQPSLTLGVRSSIFLPFANLGLVIVDEEHENTYKQQSPPPRYHARDAAIMMAAQHGAKTLLGSATPSVESYHNAATGKYGLVELAERYGRVALPEIRIVNVSYLKNKQGGRYFSPVLVNEVGAALERGEQVILFRNRRGFSPYVECKECGWIPQCEHCNVSLTYHKGSRQLVCHYCGFAIGMPHRCLACDGVSMETKGFGTEQVEEDLQLIFPDVSVERMDLDTTRTRSAYERIIEDFESRKIKILVGTQMVTKGLDFDNVSLVGVLNADSMLSYPDFRAGERSYQLMAQVSGRAGRRGKQGLVLIQTVQPQHHILSCVQRNDYQKMYLSQIDDRRELLYPPFVRLIRITLKHRSEQTLLRSAQALSRRLKAVFGNRVLGPATPLVNRVQNRYLMDFMLKIERGKSVEKAKTLLKAQFSEILQENEFRQLEIIPDVDPM